MYKLTKIKNLYLVEKENLDLSWQSIGHIRSHRERGTNFWHAVLTTRHTGSMWNEFSDAVAWVLWSDGLSIEDADDLAARLLSTL